MDENRISSQMPNKLLEPITHCKYNKSQKHKWHWWSWIEQVEISMNLFSKESSDLLLKDAKYSLMNGLNKCNKISNVLYNPNKVFDWPTHLIKPIFSSTYLIKMQRRIKNRVWVFKFGFLIRLCTYMKQMIEVLGLQKCW